MAGRSAGGRSRMGRSRPGAAHSRGCASAWVCPGGRDVEYPSRHQSFTRSPAMKRNGWLSTLSAVALSAAVGSVSFGQVTGSVKLEGKVPARSPVPGLAQNPQCAALHKEPVLDETVVADKDGNLANVIVYLKGAKGPAPKDPVVLDQKGCQYVPHVLTITVGQQLNAANSDAFLHNVHPLPEVNKQVNMAQPGKTPEEGQKVMGRKAAEFVKVKCDVHPWMCAWVGVFDHPYHSVTGDDGAFEIPIE